jgi:hypothetical protein
LVGKILDRGSIAFDVSRPLNEICPKFSELGPGEPCYAGNSPETEGEHIQLA